IEGYLKDMIAHGTFSENLPFIQSLGPKALESFNAMLSAYAAWQQAMQNSGGSPSSNPITTFTSGIGDLGNAAAEAAKRLADAKASLGDYVNSLMLDKNLSPLDPMQQLAEAKKQYEDLLALANKGDIDAISKLSGASNTYLGLARGAFGSSSDYINIFQQVVNDLAKISGTGDYNTRMLNIQTQQAKTQIDILEMLI